MTDEELAIQNDDNEYYGMREVILKCVQDSVLLDRYTQAVMNRAIRSLSSPSTPVTL
jgi:hypothetical protein